MASFFSADLEDIDVEVPEDLAQFTEEFLTCLRTKTGTARNVMSRRVACIVGKLPKDQAITVIDSVQSLCTPQETDISWQGGCFCLAEIGRKSLLPKEKLPEYVAIAVEGLFYEEKRGHFSVGSVAREAACYLVWAFAQGFSTEDLKPYEMQMARTLLKVTLYDREANVRRAASLAFQTFLEEHSLFPHAKEILYKTHHLFKGSKTVSYMKNSEVVAQFPEYRDMLISHLAEQKISNWDMEIREITAKTLHMLTDLSPEFVASTVLPQLLKMTSSPDPHTRHGSVLSIAEITHALGVQASKQKKPIVDLIGETTVKDIKNISLEMKASNLLENTDGDLMKKAVCYLMEKLSMTKFPVHEDPVLDLWEEIIDDCLTHKEPEMQMAANSAIPTFFTEYYKDPDTDMVNKEKQEKVITNYLEKTKSKTRKLRVSFSLAIGMLPKMMLAGKLDVVLQGLMEAAEITEEHRTWADVRKNALLSISSVCTTVGVEKEGDHREVLCSANLDKVYNAFLTGLKDYTIANGDAGCCVREASMSGIQAVTSVIARHDPDMISEELCKKIFQGLAQQTCEKIDRTRALGCSVFFTLLTHHPPVPHIPHQESLLEIFSSWQSRRYINWNVSAGTFPLFVKLLRYPTYTYSTLSGLLVTVGGLSESLVRDSFGALLGHFSWMKSKKTLDHMNRFTEALLDIFRDNLKNDRVTMPLLRMMDKLFTKSVFDDLFEEENHPFPMGLLALVKSEIQGSGNPKKLIASIDVFCGLIPFQGEVRQACFRSLSILLCHKYPRVRRVASNKLLEAFTMFPEVIPEDNLDEVMNFLSETVWEENVEDIRPIRNNVCTCLDIPVPTIINRAQSALIS